MSSCDSLACWLTIVALVLLLVACVAGEIYCRVHYHMSLCGYCGCCWSWRYGRGLLNAQASTELPVVTRTDAGYEPRKHRFWADPDPFG